MRSGASYYPELVPESEWNADLARGRDLGLGVLRCGEFAMERVRPGDGDLDLAWARRFLDLAADHGYDVLWCTPTAAPSPALFDRWPDLRAVNAEGVRMPTGVRRNYCPTHEGYRDLARDLAGRLARGLDDHDAVVGWQVDNELAGSGFTCYCETCAASFREWLADRYGSVAALNEAWETGFWNQVYDDWSAVPVPVPDAGVDDHAPALELAYRRFRSDAWRAFYGAQYEALRDAGAGPVTTNFYDLHWDVPFDQYDWRERLDVVALSSYDHAPLTREFELAMMRGLPGDEREVWVLEQPPGTKTVDSLSDEWRADLEAHLRTCAAAGATRAVYWHLRHHSAGTEVEHGAVLDYDGHVTRVAEAVEDAVAAAADAEPDPPDPSRAVVFSFQQQWAQESQPHWTEELDYWRVVRDDWFGAALDTGGAAVGHWSMLSAEQDLVLAPYLQLCEPGMVDALLARARDGATVVTTADLGRLDEEGVVRREPPLSVLDGHVDVPPLERYRVPGDPVGGRLGDRAVAADHFWTVPHPGESVEGTGTLRANGVESPVYRTFDVGAGKLVVLFGGLSREGVAAVIDRTA